MSDLFKESGAMSEDLQNQLTSKISKEQAANSSSYDRESILAELPRIASKIAGGAVERELNRELPFEILQTIRGTGLTWLRVPKFLGGPGGTVADQIEVICALSAADSNVAHALRTHFGFVESIAVMPEGQLSKRYVKEVLNGKLFGGAHTEINTPRPGTQRTRLVKEGAGYVLNGRKFYATGSAFSDYINCSALDEQGCVTGAIIPADRNGVRILDDWDGMGQRLTASGGIDLEDVLVFPHEVVPEAEGDAFVRRHIATRDQLHLVACIAGIVRNVLNDAISYTKKHARSAQHSHSETAHGDHFVQQVIGDIASAAHVIDVIVADVARKQDAAAVAIVEGAENRDELILASAVANSKAQTVIGELAIRAAEKLFDTGGGSATSRRYDFDRHWRNIRTILSHNPLSLKRRAIGDYYLNGVRADFDEGRVF